MSRVCFAARRAVALALLMSLAGAAVARAEDGYELWLRYHRVADATRLKQYQAAIGELLVEGRSPTAQAVSSELQRGLAGLLGRNVPVITRVTRDGVVIAGIPAQSPVVAALGLDADLRDAGAEGYIVRAMRVAGRQALVIAANADVGVLYGAFHLLRLLQTHQPIDTLSIAERPQFRHRILNHWDNLDGSVERGYAGGSLWDWHKLPGYTAPRYIDYARANASLGVNGTVLTNVNANATVLTADYLRKASALADVFRPYGVRVYLTARFSAPIEIGGLQTADPLAPEVRAWWTAKVNEIYTIIPDFGGFLVKANSEGQPGPQDYQRTHADGANMLAAALEPHGGLVMWRAFVYSEGVREDRHKQAYTEFQPLDGTFRPNVLVQVKNGAIDFQPREPFHPLFGAMPKTPLLLELQIAKEYLGFATHLVYLGPLFEEVLKADTHQPGQGEVRHIVTGVAGVANTGTDRNWCGSVFSCANWHAFGRLAWNPERSAAALAEEWIRMTFTNDASAIAPVKDIMLASRQAAVDYMTPLGLHHLMARGHHYGPGPWVSGGPRADWTSVYYHRADAGGIGFDRTRTGSDAVSQYAPTVRDRFASLDRVTDDDLLWFHRVPWDHRTSSGRPLWDELTFRYCRGVRAVRDWRRTWDRLAPSIDRERHDETRAFLALQEDEAKWWRDASVLYFQTFAQRPIADECGPPANTLEHYMSINLRFVPGELTMPLQPTPADKFTFGLWTVGNRGRDPFGEFVRPALDPCEAVRRLADLGAWGVNFHDNDLVPIDATPTDRDRIVSEFRRTLEATGMTVPMATTNLFTDPVFKDGAFTAHDPQVRAYALQKTMRAMDLGVELGARTYVFWGGREGAEVDAAKDPLEAIKRFRGAIDFLCEYARDQRYDLRFALEAKPNEPRGDIYFPTTASYLAFIGTLAHHEMVGVNPEFAHEQMIGLNFLHVVAQALEAGKLFHIDLNDQKPGRFDQDLRFASESIKPLFFLVKLLEESGYDGPRHFDAHAYRTEDPDGVWDFARGCMRSYLILKAKARQFAEHRGIQDLLAEIRGGDGAAPPYSRATAQQLKDRAFDRAALAAKPLPYERLDQMLVDLLLGAG